MDATLLGLIGVLAGMASFFGVFKYSGRISGKWAAMKQKRITAKTVSKLKTQELKDLALESAKKANDLFLSENGKMKMDWLVNILVKSIPGTTDDQAVREWAQGFYESYKEEINK